MATVSERFTRKTEATCRRFCSVAVPTFSGGGRVDRRHLVVLLLAGGLVGGSLFGQARAVDVTASVGIVNEPFTGATTGNVWALPAPGPAVQNEACLTGGTTAPIPQCASDPGVAGLQLTTAATTREGGINYANSVPTTSAIDVTFNS